MQQENFQFQKLSALIIHKIALFLSSKDLTQVALSSRKTRLIFGEVIQKSLQEQSRIFSQKQDFFLKAENDCLKQYSQIIKEIKPFENEVSYERFIQLLSSKNIDFYKYFFSAVLDREIQLNEKNLMTQKAGLLKLRNEVYQNLQNLTTFSKVPSLKVQNAQFSGFYSQQVTKIVEFVKSFLRILEVIQKIPQVDQLYKKYILTQKYIKSFKYLEKPSIKNQYKQPIYYICGKKCYHNYIGFNVNSIVLSFLRVADLKNLMTVDKIFAYQIPKSIGIIINKAQMNYQKLMDIPIKQEIKETMNIYLQNQKVVVHKSDLYELQAFNNPPQVVQEVIEKLLNIFNIIPKTFQYNLSQLYQNIDIILFVFNSQFIELNEKQVQFLHGYINEENERRNLLCSRIGNKIYLNFKMNYFMAKYNITNNEIQSYQQLENRKQKQQEYLTELKTI